MQHEDEGIVVLMIGFVAGIITSIIVFILLEQFWKWWEKNLRRKTR